MERRPARPTNEDCDINAIGSVTPDAGDSDSAEVRKASRRRRYLSVAGGVVTVR